MYLAVMVGKFVKQHVREWYPSTTGPLLRTVTDGLGILCLRTCYHRFTILSRAPNGLCNEHSRSDRINLGPNCSLDTGGGGGPQYIGGALSAVRVQRARGATIWASCRSRNPYFVALWASLLFGSRF